MSAAPTENEPLLGAKTIIIIAVIAVGLMAASIWSLARAFGGSADAPRAAAPHKVEAPAGGEAMLSQEEIDLQHAQYTPPAPVPAAAPAPSPPVLQENKERVLQQTKNDVNRQLVDKLKQFVRDHPELDNAELEKQIRKRESQIAPVP